MKVRPVHFLLLLSGKNGLKGQKDLSPGQRPGKKGKLQDAPHRGKRVRFQSFAPVGRNLGVEYNTQGVQWSLHPLRFPRFAGDGNPGLMSHWPLTFPSAVDLWFRPFSTPNHINSFKNAIYTGNIKDKRKVYRTAMKDFVLSVFFDV
jgi:hypothetical protein